MKKRAQHGECGASLGLYGNTSVVCNGIKSNRVFQTVDEARLYVAQEWGTA